MKKGVRIILLIAWIMIIFILTGYPALKTPRVKELPVDKLYHFIIFFIFGLLAIPLLKRFHYYLLGSGVLILSEAQQLFIPGRDFEILDLLAGFIGLISIYLIKKSQNALSET